VSEEELLSFHHQLRLFYVACRNASEINPKTEIDIQLN
jgi:hypothetical protein